MQKCDAVPAVREIRAVSVLSEAPTLPTTSNQATSAQGKTNESDGPVASLFVKTLKSSQCDSQSVE